MHRSNRHNHLQTFFWFNPGFNLSLIFTKGGWKLVFQWAQKDRGLVTSRRMTVSANTSGVRFSKSRKLFGSISGAINIRIACVQTSPISFAARRLLFALYLGKLPYKYLKRLVKKTALQNKRFMFCFQNEMAFRAIQPFVSGNTFSEGLNRLRYSDFNNCSEN